MVDRHPVEYLAGEFAQHAQVVEVADGAGAAGEEHVGCGLVAFGGQYESQVVGRSVSDIEVDTGRGFEGLEDRSDQLLATSRVHGDRTIAVVAATGCEAGDQADAQERAGDQGMDLKGHVGFSFEESQRV